MRYFLAAMVLLPTVALAIGMMRGRARVRSCCPADTADDARMRGVTPSP